MFEVVRCTELCDTLSGQLTNSCCILVLVPGMYICQGSAGMCNTGVALQVQQKAIQMYKVPLRDVPGGVAK